MAEQEIQPAPPPTAGDRVVSILRTTVLFVAYFLWGVAKEVPPLANCLRKRAVEAWTKARTS